jgi:hypothetical protein
MKDLLISFAIVVGIISFVGGLIIWDFNRPGDPDDVDARGCATGSWEDEGGL